MLNNLNIQKITTKRDCFNEQELLTYVQEKCDKQLRFDIENHLLDCEICSDVVEGLQIIEKKGNTENYLSEVKAQKNNLFIEQKSSNKALWFSIAALFIVVLGSYWFFSQQASEIKQQEFAQRIEETKPEQSETKKTEAPAQEILEDNSAVKDKKEASNSPEKKGSKQTRSEEASDEMGLNSAADFEPSKKLAEESFSATGSVGAGSTTINTKNDKSIDANLSYTLPPLEQSTISTSEGIKSSGEIMMDDDVVNRKENVAREKKEEEKDSKKSKGKENKITATNTSPAAVSKDESSGANAAITSKNPMEEGVKLFNQKNYQDAATLFTQIYYKDSSIEAAYRSALSYFKLANYVSSKSMIDVVMRTQNTWNEDAEWLLYEILSAQKNTTEAKTLLEKISAKNGKFASQAKQELEKLK